jgi:hypothetical protein
MRATLPSVEKPGKSCGIVSNSCCRQPPRANAAIGPATKRHNGQVSPQLAAGESVTLSRTSRLIFLQLYNAWRSRQT